MYTMADYTTKAQNLYLNVTGNPTERLLLHGSLVYNKSTAEYDRVLMPDVSARLDGALSHQDFTFDEMHTYSNLDYTIIQATLGFEYKIAAGVTYTIDGEYADLSDDAGYVFGIESGSLSMIRTGLRFAF
jgi:hypothetical protein